VRHGRFPLVGNGEQQRSMVFTANLVDAALLADSVDAAAGRAYWIADAEPYPLRTILETVRRALVLEDLPVSGRLPRIPAFAAVIAERADGLLQSRGRYSQALHVLGELRHTIACDITRARSELGYAPAVSLLDGMRASIRWCRERGEEL
jgi:nucleoside-diphosphate-sugar epimerase